MSIEARIEVLSEGMLRNCLLWSLRELSSHDCGTCKAFDYCEKNNKHNQCLEMILHQALHELHYY